MMKRLAQLAAAALLIALGAFGSVVLSHWRSGRSLIVADAGRSKESYARDRLCVSLMQLGKADLAVQEFRVEHGRLPQDLGEVLGKPVRDAWNNELVYRPNEDGTYVIISPGPDHLLGTADDQTPDELVDEFNIGVPSVPRKCLSQD
jgi:hypothetical protein